MTTRPPYTERIWLEGLDQEAAAFVAAIPAERRSYWRRIFIAEPPEPPEPENDERAASRRAERVYVVFVKDRAYVTVGIAIDVLRAGDARFFRYIEERARAKYEADLMPVG